MNITPLPIFLIGYMATGKTTLGRALARETGRQHIDLDFYIEQRFRMTVREIFATKGEAEFRRIEAAMLREAGEIEGTIISCGGGTPCFSGNMDYMNSRGITVCLRAGEEIVADRILLGGNKRPLMAGKSREEVLATLREQMALRDPFYSQAQLTLSADRLETRPDIAATARRLLAQLGELN